MRRALIVLGIVLGFVGDARAQSCASTQGQLEYCKALTPAVRFGFPRYATASLPACNTNNKGAVVFDTTDGFFKNCDGSAWAAFASGGSGDVTAVGDCATGACFNGTAGTTLTFNNAGGDATIDYDGTDFSISKPIVVTGTIGLTSTITFPDNVRQTANPGADAAGLNVGSLAGDPGTPSNGDIWYDSTGNSLDARINGATVSLGAGGGAPTDATYITQTANGSLSAEQALGALSTGCLGSATTTGVVSAVTITGTANEVSVANGDCTGAPTLSLPATIDLGGKTSFEIPNGAAPTVDAFGEIAGDNDLWAASRGAPVFFDGTASTALVNVLVSDAPANGECPKWNTGGTITWESCAGGGVTIGDTQVAYATAANTLGGDSLFTFTAASNTLAIGDNTTGGYITQANVLGSELMPALSGATTVNWTFGAGWATPLSSSADHNANGTNTLTPTAATAIVAGTTYKVVITLSACTTCTANSVGASYTLGGISGPSFLDAATTYTDYVIAGTTGNLIITPTSTSRFVISSISVKEVTTTGGTTLGATNFTGPVSFPTAINAQWNTIFRYPTTASGGPATTNNAFHIVVPPNPASTSNLLCLSTNTSLSCNAFKVDYIGGITTHSNGSLTTGTVIAGSGNTIGFSGRTELDSDGANGKLGIENAANSSGVHLQFLAAPTIASGFGTTPSIAGNDTAGRVTVGTGGTDVTGVVTFNATWATAPACVCNNEVTTLLCKATATTTTLTLTSATAFTAADTLTYLCVGY